MKSIITPPLLLLCGLMTMAAAAPPAVTIEPHPHNPPDQNQYLAFMAKAPWLDGYIRVRFPENINSKFGLHFLDNLQPELPRVSKVALPEWQTDPGTGALFYQVKTAEGIGFAGRVRVEGEVIHMEYTVTNGTKEVQDLTSQVCFDMAPAKGLNERITLDHTFTWIGGEYRSLETTTSPKREAKFAKNGFNWLLMLYNEQPDDPMRKIEDECFWWIADQKPDLPLMVRETADRKHLVAITWESSTVRRLMTNTNIPCLHADPLECKNLPPGESRTWRGRIFMMENDPAKLLEAFNKPQ
jgi:hypothetical protein